MYATVPLIITFLCASLSLAAPAIHARFDATAAADSRTYKLWVTFFDGIHHYGNSLKACHIGAGQEVLCVDPAGLSGDFTWIVAPQPQDPGPCPSPANHTGFWTNHPGFVQYTLPMNNGAGAIVQNLTLPQNGAQGVRFATFDVAAAPEDVVELWISPARELVEVYGGEYGQGSWCVCPYEDAGVTLGAVAWVANGQAADAECAPVWLSRV